MNDHTVYGCVMLLLFGAWFEYVVPAINPQPQNALIIASFWSIGLIVSRMIGGRS